MMKDESEEPQTTSTLGVQRWIFDIGKEIGRVRINVEYRIINVE
jgi:hypothetical protein